MGCRLWGDGPTTVLFVHGNLASKDWIELAAPWFPPDIRVIGLDWRGCGDSDRPPPGADYANYRMEVHAADMLAALDTLGVGFCHLATHSTGGVIAAHMLLARPERFGKVLALDPVAPLGLAFDEQGFALFEAMRSSPEVTRAVMATAAASLFEPDSLGAGKVPQLRAGAGPTAAMFERVVRGAFGVAEGVWLGTPRHLTEERRAGCLSTRMPELRHEHLVLWGEQDGWIPAADLKMMTRRMPDCRLVTVPGVGHSMNLERPELYAGYFGAFFGGLNRVS
ncbi:alpha/beta fold hydrolase [Sabulicella rubraurantiaca]|uniref:alpha/beta fold hydrolase n=1 Tax=Sabulicella rubraurantiaca TaxID=2811429 RepID=UPI001A96AE92|nr:alpha/beta hydrolase [Sabulicella rubraurantiaca]